MLQELYHLRCKYKSNQDQLTFVNGFKSSSGSNLTKEFQKSFAGKYKIQFEYENQFTPSKLETQAPNDPTAVNEYKLQLYQGDEYKIYQLLTSFFSK